MGTLKFQFFYKSKTVLKNNVYLKNKKIFKRIKSGLWKS